MLTSWSCTIRHNTKQVHKVLNLDKILKYSELRLWWRNLKWSSQHICTRHSVLIGLINRLRKRCLGTVKVFLNSTNEIVNCNLHRRQSYENVMVDIHFANILPHFLVGGSTYYWNWDTLTAPSYLGHDSPVPDVVEIVRHIVDHRGPELTEFLAWSHPAAAADNWGFFCKLVPSFQSFDVPFTFFKSKVKYLWLMISTRTPL